MEKWRIESLNFRANFDPAFHPEDDQNPKYK